MKVSAAMLRLRFDNARLQAVREALENQDTTLAETCAPFSVPGYQAKGGERD